MKWYNWWVNIGILLILYQHYPFNRVLISVSEGLLTYLTEVSVEKVQ